MIVSPAGRRLCAAVVVVAATVAGCGSDDETDTVDQTPSYVEAGALTVCTSLGYAPFEFEKNGNPVGFDIDLANEIAKDLGLKTEIVNKGFGAIESGRVLNNGECDVAIAAITITGERARVLDFSSPYFDAASQAMVVQEGSGIDSLEELAELRIGVQAGTTGELYVTDHAPGDAEIVPFEDTADIETALRDGEVDAVVYDNTVVDDVVGRYPEFEVATEFGVGEQYGIAVKKNSNVDLLRLINDRLAEIQTGNVYDAIYNRWFGESPPE